MRRVGLRPRLSRLGTCCLCAHSPERFSLWLLWTLSLRAGSVGKYGLGSVREIGGLDQLGSDARWREIMWKSSVVPSEPWTSGRCVPRVFEVLRSWTAEDLQGRRHE